MEPPFAWLPAFWALRLDTSGSQERASCTSSRLNPGNSTSGSSRAGFKFNAVFLPSVKVRSVVSRFVWERPNCRATTRIGRRLDWASRFLPKSDCSPSHHHRQQIWPRRPSGPQAPPRARPLNHDTRPVPKSEDVANTTSDGPRPSERPAQTSAADPDRLKGAEPAGGQPEPPKPWLPLTLTVAGLCASVGGNLYFGWLYLETRRRYRALLRRRHGVTGSQAEM